MPEQMQQDPINALLSEFSTRLNEVEEKQRLIKDRALLIGKNLISTKEEDDKEFSNIKKRLSKTEEEIKSIKQLAHRIVEELGNLARKTEVQALQKQMMMFQPLKLARIKDVKDIVRKELKKK
ncbi:hypothetical protein HOE04_05480 [archaeon]|jgi:hypothetical protein|nr:hypothetical protein [archaeon]